MDVCIFVPLFLSSFILLSPAYATASSEVIVLAETLPSAALLLTHSILSHFDLGLTKD